MPQFYPLIKIMGSYSCVKLEGVGPVDNRPFTEYLHQFEEEKKEEEKKKKNLTPDTWQVISAP